jgi:hypothetical protein
MMYTCVPRDAAASRSSHRKSVKRADMDKTGVDVQAISTSPLQYHCGTLLLEAIRPGSRGSSNRSDD